MRAPAVVAEMPATDVAAEEEAAGEAVVVATILRNADGSFTLETGEPEMPMDPAMGAEATAPAGQTFAADEGGIGQLMTAVLDLVDPANAGGAMAKAAFEEGFSGAPAAPPAA